MVSNARRNQVAAAACIAFALLLSGCASTFDVLPEKLGGLPSNAPARPAETSAFPSVYSPEQPREVKSLSEDEQKKLGSDLMALRDSQAQRAAPDQPAAQAKKAAERKKPAPQKVAAKKAPAPKPAEVKPLELKPN